MKHFTLLLAAATISAMPAMAAPAKGPVQHPGKIAKATKAPAKGISLNHRTLDLSRLQPVQRLSRAESMPIYGAEGESKMYSVDILGYDQFLGQLYFEPTSGMKQVVWGEDGDVYIKDFVNIGADTYVVGKYADGKITIDFPQPVYYVNDEEGETVYSLNVLEFDEEAEYMYKNVEPDKAQVVIDVAEDGTMSFNLNPDYSYDDFEDAGDLPLYIVGLTEITEPGASDWFGYGDCSQEYAEFNLTTITPPDDAVFDKWVFSYTNTNESKIGVFCDVAIAGNDIYLGNLHEDVPAWVKGTISDGKAFFESGQYMGYSDLYSTNFYFLTGEFSEVYLEEWDFWDFHVEFTDGISFDYDAEAKTLICDTENMSIVFNADPEELYFLDIAINPEVKWQDPTLCNAAPLDPEFMAYQAWDPDFYGGQGGIIWSIPAENVLGAILDTKRMYYNFIVDGEIYAIDPEEYPFVEEYMEDIPYDYTDGMDIFAMGDEHDIYFYFDGAESFGLQSFYVGDDDVVYASQIVTYYPETDSTTGIGSVNAEVVSGRYFDLSGREVANPANGLYIKAVKLSDGSTRNIKVIIK